MSSSMFNVQCDDTDKQGEARISDGPVYFRG
jgi:hypothetical protein